MSLNVTINQVLKPKYRFTGNMIYFTFKCIIKVLCSQCQKHPILHKSEVHSCSVTSVFSTLFCPIRYRPWDSWISYPQASCKIPFHVWLYNSFWFLVFFI